MLPPKKTQDLARSLVARETGPNAGSPHSEPATRRVYEKLRRQLGTPVGADGFHTLAARALALARAESPRLNDVQLTATGGLYGLDAVEAQSGSGQDDEDGILLISQLLGLFLTLLGEATTLRLLEDLRLQTEVSADSPVTPKSGNLLLAEEAFWAVAFEDLLHEIDRLRSVSEHIEALAAAHPGMEDGLVSAAGSIRNIATVLDVFTLIRSRAGGQQDQSPSLQTNRYMN